MHTIKHIRFLCQYAKKYVQMTKHLYESIVSQVSLILSNWQIVCKYITRYKVFGIISSLSAWLNHKWNYFNAMIVMILMTVVH